MQRKIMFDEVLGRNTEKLKEKAGGNTVTQYKLQYMEAQLEGIHQEMQIMIQDMERKN